MSNATPSDAPPAYDKVVGNAPSSSSASGNAAGAAGPAASSTSTSTGAGHTPHRQSSLNEERDIEQEDRPLPPGWIPQFSEEHERFYFVDTKDPNGPRSIWWHPLDDPTWLSKVPAGMDPLVYIHKLWDEVPMPSPVNRQSQLPGVRQGGTANMQGHFPGTNAVQSGQQAQYGRMVNGKRVVTLEELTQIYLDKMGTPEEYERKNPPSKASKMFHTKETARERQRRHAEHKARDAADALSYRRPMYPPAYPVGMYGPRYGYPSYGRPYGMAYPGLGMSGAFLGLGAGALLGSAMF